VMPELNPVHIDMPATAEGDPRIGHFLGRGLTGDEPPTVALLGFPSDEGVRRNNGRPGASAAPMKIREHLYRLTPPPGEYSDFTDLIEKTRDLGNVPATLNLEEAQDRLGTVVADVLDKGVIPVILGGGHETAYGHFLGYAKNEMNVSVLNIDAHADVRPLKNGKAHSGSPFRQALEHPSEVCESYRVAGLQPHSTAKAHVDYLEDRNARVVFREDTNEGSIAELLEGHESQKLMVTFDMDAVDQAFAPGVSAPCTNGLNVGTWLKAACLAGRDKRVSSFDISEVNPEYDRDNQTVRLAAVTIWHFLLGISRRKR